MKKLLSTILCAAIIFGSSIISLAADDATITQDSQPQSGKITVDYDMEVTYTVTIPASVTFTDTDKTIERPLQVTDVRLNEGSSLIVNLASLNDFQMKCGEGYIDYYIMINYATVLEENNCNILIVNADDRSGWVVFQFITELDKTNALYAGDYTDILTFSVKVD